PEIDSLSLHDALPISDLERQVESELVIRLLEGAADAAAVAGRLGLAPQGLRVIALQAGIADEQHAALLVIFERATTGFGWSRSRDRKSTRLNSSHVKI